MISAENINVGDFFSYEDYDNYNNPIILYGLVVSVKEEFDQRRHPIRKVVFLKLDGTLCSNDYSFDCRGYDLNKITL